MNTAATHRTIAALMVGIAAVGGGWRVARAGWGTPDAGHPLPAHAAVAGAADPTGADACAAGGTLIGAAGSTSVTLNTLATKGEQVRVVLGDTPGHAERTLEPHTSDGTPVVTTITGLSPNTRYYYRVQRKPTGQADFSAGTEQSFQTQRAPGSAFTFAVQGDSHPERTGTMFDAALYSTTLRNVAARRPDLYYAMGDDFSIERLIAAKQQNQAAVDEVYRYQRQFLDTVGCSASINLVNGNHEQAARYLLDGSDHSFPALAAKARATYYPRSSPDGFFSGDAEPVAGIGLLGDYYAYEWGDALFVTIDPYWHSESAVDNSATGGAKNQRDPWGSTLGEAQYRWLTTTLEGSHARYKFVFAHHVLGTGRGGVEEAGLYEWGGHNTAGAWEFDRKRPGWALPIHQLMVKTGVTVFFQGHDHLYAHQELDGVTYQEVPNPADPTYTAFNADAYTSGTILPNSGFLLVSVSPVGVTVDYVGSGRATNGTVLAGYEVRR